MYLVLDQISMFFSLWIFYQNSLKIRFMTFIVWRLQDKSPKHADALTTLCSCSSLFMYFCCGKIQSDLAGEGLHACTSVTGSSFGSSCRCVQVPLHLVKHELHSRTWWFFMSLVPYLALCLSFSLLYHFMYLESHVSVLWLVHLLSL